MAFFQLNTNLEKQEFPKRHVYETMDAFFSHETETPLMLQLVRNMRVEAGVDCSAQKRLWKKTCHGFQGKIVCNFVLANASIGSSHIFWVFIDLLIKIIPPKLELGRVDSHESNGDMPPWGKILIEPGQRAHLRYMMNQDSERITWNYLDIAHKSGYSKWWESVAVIRHLRKVAC